MSSEKKMTSDINKLNEGTNISGNFGIRNNRGVKVCPHCGTEHALTAHNICSVCSKEIISAEERKKRNSMLMMACQQRKADKIQALLDELNPLQSKLPVLTDHEWLKACKHFKQCAICADNDIEVRFMVILPGDGGRYNRGNVLPTCTKCANRIGRNQHSFASSIAREARVKRDSKRPERVCDAIRYLIQEAQHE